jgi:P27 family predicted phage terminase small subunit
MRADRINRREPTAPAGRPEPPAYLDAEARAKWDDLVSTAEAMGTLTQAEGEAITLYAQAYSRKRKAEAHLETHGIAIETESGGLKANPALRVIESCEAIMFRILSEFGLMPAAKSKVHIQQPAASDKLTEFLAGRWERDKSDS